jgi:hypothetical protein
VEVVAASSSRTAARDLSRLSVVHSRVADALRAKSGAERLRLAHESWELARDRLTAYLAAQHPEWSRRRVETDVAKRLLGDSG